MTSATESPTPGASIPGASVHEDTIVPACRPWSARIRKGDRLRLIDLEGQQAVDFLCYGAADPAERYNAANTMKLNKNIYLGQGSVLWSVRARKMMTIVEDTCGRHDTLYGCCSIEVDEVRFGKTKTQGCQSNFEVELAKYGLGEKDMVANINFFMYVPVEADGAVAIAEGLSKPGDHVDLRAEMDLLVVISNCPERDNPAAGFEPTPVRAIVYSPA
jgi:urea carboxylase-associated protein 1